MKVEIKNRRKTGKSTKGWKSKHIFKQHISQKENTLKTNENENKKQHNKIYEMQSNQDQRETCNYKCFH